MKVLAWLVALVAAIVAIGGAVASVIALSPIALIISLLGATLFFVALSSARRRTVVIQTFERQPAQAPARSPRVSDREKMRRVAAKLGIEPEPERKAPENPNDVAAREALRAAFARSKRAD